MGYIDFDKEMIPLEVVGVRIELPSNQPIVLLKEREGSRYLAIWVGSSEATAIAFAQQGISPARPLTHDLIGEVVASLEATVSSVQIVEIRDGIFYSDVVLTKKSGVTVSISARPSDAIALALRTKAEISASPELLDEVGISIPEQEGESAETEVERFREFLDQINPEDFQG